MPSRRMDQNRKRKNEDEVQDELNMGSGIRRKVEIDESFEKELQAERGITILKTNAEKKLTEKRLIVVLENANLELVKNGKKVELLNADTHRNILKKHGRDLGTARPDITHQILLNLMDSPLNRANLLQVYIKTVKNVLIEINPATRIPRTFNRFCGLMVTLLEKLSVRADGGPIKLMKVIKNPVTDHLPAGCKKTLFTYTTTGIIRPLQLAAEAGDTAHCVVIGAMAHGKVDVDYCEKEVSISNYPLSAALCAARLTAAFEEHWGIH